MKRAERKKIVRRIVEPYLTAKKDRTIVAQYERIEGGEDGRIRTVLSPVTTETGRLASSESFIDTSTNLQNLTKKEGMKDPLYKVRDCFIPDEGMTLMASDLDKAEAVICAFESEDWDFYEKLIEGYDTHKWIAALAFHGGNMEAVSKHERSVCKNVYYASLYKGGVPTITRTVNQDADILGFRLTESETATVLATILEVTKLEPWWDTILSELWSPDVAGGVRWLENCFGFRRRFYEPELHRLEKKAINFKPQSTVANIIDRVMIETHEWEREGEFEFLLQVHDEVLFQVRDDKVDEYAHRLREAMQRPFHSQGREVFITAGLEVAKRWSELEEWKKP
jgi:DNA polymerase-1